MKICPICDHELGITNFCPVCKTIVKEPWVLNDGIYINHSHSLPDNFCEFHTHDRKELYLNRSHPSHEIDCSYHNPEHTLQYMDGGDLSTPHTYDGGVSTAHSYGSDLTSDSYTDTTRSGSRPMSPGSPYHGSLSDIASAAYGKNQKTQTMRNILIQSLNSGNINQKTLRDILNQSKK